MLDEAFKFWLRKSLWSFSIWQGNTSVSQDQRQSLSRIEMVKKKKKRTSIICYLHPLHVSIRKMWHSVYHAAFLCVTLSNFNNSWILCTSTIKRFHTFCWFAIGSNYLSKVRLWRNIRGEGLMVCSGNILHLHFLQLL